MGFIIHEIKERWPHSIIPYEINVVFNGDRRKFQDAIDQWNIFSDVKLVPRNGEKDYISFEVGTKNESKLGRVQGKQIITMKTTISIDKRGVGNIMHEIGHACGLIHEHQRPDRDKFVIVDPLLSNDNDYAIDSQGITIGSYDCCSIMHYDGSNITSLTGDDCLGMGQRVVLSQGDLNALRVMYPIVGITSLNDRSDYSPALAFHQNRLFFAWTGEDDYLNLATVDIGVGDSINGISNKITLGVTSDDNPVLASHNGQLFLAWTGEDNHLNLATVDIGTGNSITGISNNITLGDKSDDNPVLASHDGQLFIAWTGQDDHLNVATVKFGALGNISGISSNRKTLGDKSNYNPALTSHNGRLYLAWTGQDRYLNITLVDIGAGGDITGISKKKTLYKEKSKDSPSLASHHEELYLIWNERWFEYLYIMPIDIFSGFFNEKRISYEKSAKGPALASNPDSRTGQLFISWNGSGNEDLNIGHISLPPRVPGMIGSPHSGNAFQSTFAISNMNGDFELLVVQDRKLGSFSRSNDLSHHPPCDKGVKEDTWVKKNESPDVSGRNVPKGVNLIQSTIMGNGINGNLEAMVWANFPNSTLITYFLDSEQLQWKGPFEVFVDGNKITGITSKPALIQRAIGTALGTKGNFEMLVPLGNSLKHCFLEPNGQKPPWINWVSSPFQPKVPAGATIHSVALIESNYKDNVGHGRLDAIVSMSTIDVPGGALFHYFLDTNVPDWIGPNEITVGNNNFRGVGIGNPSFIQSTFHHDFQFKMICKEGNYEMFCSGGDFEMLVPQGDRLRHFFRENDSSTPIDTNWLERSTEPIIPKNFFPKAVSLFQSNVRSNCKQGNLHAIVLLGSLVDPISFLASYCFNSNTKKWNGPFTITVNGTPISDVTAF
ncbi:M12 family metallopeptidase [Bacillus sp. ISL-77]|uniref:M12 family metallopeptidase n=1 Tax=Bacillus sp. ISL-77 TaxID=2819138 RepID=UPI001BE91C4D|nr:M12 family metallopeptidase [Bacillus sp. ISL-77]MBT2740548.1 hypothetical protein [Bacillus sp. ISL-77]